MSLATGIDPLQQDLRYSWLVGRFERLSIPVGDENVRVREVAREVEETMDKKRSTKEMTSTKKWTSSCVEKHDTHKEK